MTATKTNTRLIPRQETKGHKLAEILIVIGAMLAICLFAAMVLKKQAEQLLIEPTSQQEKRIFEEANRQLNQTGMVEIYLGRSGEKQ